MSPREHIAQRAHSIAAAGTPLMLNLGCGHRFCRSWLNIDANGCGEDVLAWDLANGIPLPDGSADVVYHSHVLEHLDYDAAQTFLDECLRVLRPGGTLRIVVPDLEAIARAYLATLERALESRSARAEHEWMILELYDQVVRERHGGRVTPMLREADPDFEAFVVKRWGSFAAGLIAQIRSAARTPPPPRRSILQRVFWNAIRPRQILPKAREKAIRLMLGREYEALQRGRFIASGELHRWMYDRLSLRNCLESSGFKDVEQCTATTSRIAGWEGFRLDADAASGIYKAESLYMEACKPVETACRP